MRAISIGWARNWFLYRDAMSCMQTLARFRRNRNHGCREMDGMQRTLLKSKIHRATVTDADLHYEGSVSIDPDLMKAADVLPFEKVEIYDVTNGSRLSTYAIEGNPGEICINGAAAHLVKPGDLVIIASYAILHDQEVAEFKPKVLLVDSDNRVVQQATSAS